MKGICFYEQYHDMWSKRQPVGNVVAVHTAINPATGDHDGYAALYLDRPNSPVVSDGISDRYLALYCKRISEAKARTIHPDLFAYLDRSN